MHKLKTVVIMVWGLGGLLTGKGEKETSGCQMRSVFNLAGGFRYRYRHRYRCRHRYRYMKSHWAVCLRSVFFEILFNII